MMFARSRIALASVVALALVAGACGNDDEASTTEAESAAADSSEAAVDTSTGDGMTYAIVDTNQGTCYDNSALIDCPSEGEVFYGQDAQFTGNTPSYTDNGDGTISDNVTGLVWTQEISSFSMAWSESASYCESLDDGGLTDWRVPSVKELWSIRDFSQGWPWVDTDYFHLVGDGSDQRQQHTWTSNLYMVESEYQNEQVQGDPAWIVNDWTGHIKAMSGSRFVRCVSGEEGVYGVNDFVDNGDRTISDNATGLMWTQDDNGAALNWEDALAYAESADVAGYDDWRLPTTKELQSLADYSGVFPVIDASVFNLTELTNAVGQTDYPFYWSSTTNPYIEALAAEVDDSDSDSDYVPGYTYAWIQSSGYTPDMDGYDLHGAGAVVFDTKSEEVSDGSGIEVFYHYVRLVRDGGVTATPAGDPTAVDPDRVVSFEDGDTGGGQDGGPPEGGASGPEGGADQQGPDLAAAASELGVTEEELAAALGDTGPGEAPDLEAASETLGITVEELEAALGPVPGS